jgi:hypothetical protein
MRHSRWVTAVLFAPLAAVGCQFEHHTQEEVFARARSVFRARVVEVRLAKFANPFKSEEQAEIVEGRFEVEEVYKGTPPASGIVRDFVLLPGNCSLGLFPGWDYVFVPDKQGFVLLPSQSIAFFDPDAPDPKKAIDLYRAMAGHMGIQ